jgi:hypothetical protein
MILVEGRSDSLGTQEKDVAVHASDGLPGSDHAARPDLAYPFLMHKDPAVAE